LAITGRSRPARHMQDDSSRQRHLRSAARKRSNSGSIRVAAIVPFNLKALWAMRIVNRHVFRSGQHAGTLAFRVVYILLGTGLFFAPSGAAASCL
jgi:hypothetical protein